MNSHHQNLSFSLDSLYCEEEQSWDDEQNTDNCFIQDDDDMGGFSDHMVNHKHFVEFLEHGFFRHDDEDLNFLLSKEHGNELYNGLKENPCLANARNEAVDWMLRVVGCYSFSSLTAILAVNYLDRFLFKFQFQTEKQPWMSQLLAVTCLSLAAKVEETDVPLLLDLQIEESEYVFEPKTIQRMEILVLSTLEWKMNPVTPLSFLDSIAKKLSLKGHLCIEFSRRCESILLSIVSDCRFMCHKPSALATATMLYVVITLNPYIALEHRDELMGILGIDKIEVEDCCKLIEEVATSVHYQYSSNKRKLLGSLMMVPNSPKGVTSVCFSSDDDGSSNDSWAVAASNVTASVTSSPEPMCKKIKVSSSEPRKNPEIF